MSFLDKSNTIYHFNVYSKRRLFCQLNGCRAQQRFQRLHAERKAATFIVDTEDRTISA